MVFESLLDPVFSPLLQLHPLWGIAIISLILTWIITLVYKWVTDQKLMKELKDDIKSVQKEMKEFKDNPAKVIEIQKKAMEKNIDTVVFDRRGYKYHGQVKAFADAARKSGLHF